MKKKSLKKVTSAVLVAAMSMGLLAGCGGSKSSGEAKTDADGATVIKFGIHVANPKKQETVTYNIVQGFNKENKGKYNVDDDQKNEMTAIGGDLMIESIRSWELEKTMK